MINKKAQANIQLILVILSTFAFAYIMHQSEGNFKELQTEYNTLQQKKLDLIANLTQKLILKLTAPMIPMVSAETSMGCCAQTINNEPCAVTIPELCTPGRLFAANTQCEQTSFCKTGCCVDDSSGTCDKSVIQSTCKGVWTADKNCNLPQCQLGCCNLGNSGILSTEKQCEIYTEKFVLGENKQTDWDATISEAQCVLSSLVEKKGACITSTSEDKKNCKMMTNKECLSTTGTLENFVEGKLCTSPELNTVCEKTKETTCVDGKDEVYFKDSCGNPANIYDASRVDDQTYWDVVVAPENSCNAGNGNANSQDCGNCDRFLGGKCSSSTQDKFEVTIGNNYCKQTSCLEDGVLYKNGESWCVYDGAIGNGDDVVGSRHWRHICSLGTIISEPCADYRNQICVQSNTLEATGDTVDFRQSFCRPNMWRDCMKANDVEKGESKESPLDCLFKQINGGGSYDLEFVAPKYPPGFDLSGDKKIMSGEDICKMASLTCTKVMVAKTWGGCECADGCNCDSPKTLEEMNDFCRSLGDCGLKANIVGNVQEGCKVSKGEFSEEYKAKLAELAIPIKGQIAEPGDLSEYLAAAGINGTSAGSSEEASSFISSLNMIGMGAGVVGTGATWLAGTSWAAAHSSVGAVSVAADGTSGGASLTGATPGLQAFGGAMMGAAIGMMVGSYLAKMGGAPSGWAMVAMASGAVAGAIAGTAIASVGWEAAIAGCIPPGPWCIAVIILIVIMIIASFAFGSNCKPIEIKYTCEAWQPPAGGDDCNKCNGDPLKPCSEYRCQSLGAACQLINKGTAEEMCDAMKNDARPPVITMGNSSDGTIFTQTERGFKVTKENGDCLNAYEPQLLSFSTNKPAQCRFGTNQVAEFTNMSASFGNPYYTYNHVLPFNLPDPSHGMSQGINWSGDLNLYVLCQDAYGNQFREPYKIEACVYQGKDITPPTITRTEPATNSLLSFNTTSVNFTAYTTEPATCKWSNNDEKFATMIKNMNCEQNILNRGLYGYPCKVDLPINSTQTNVYIACQDQPWLNESSQKSTMSGNVKIVLDKVASPIKIDNIAPKEDLETDTTMKTVELGVQTSDGAKWHVCSYSFSGYNTMIPFYTTGERVHKQSFNLPIGTHQIFIECKDETGDSVRGETNFRIIQDTSAPKIARIFRMGTSIKVITTEEADCRYSTDKCSFTFTNGTTIGSGLEHSISSKGGEVYYVKCKDEWGNTPSLCSVTIAGL